MGCRAVQLAVAGGAAAVSVRGWRAAQSGAGRVCGLAQGSRYSVPWQYAGQDVWVQEIAGEVDIRTGRERIAMHGKAQRKHSVLTFPPHHQGIPLGARRAEGKILIHLRQSAPEVEKRSLAAYERVANRGGR